MRVSPALEAGDTLVVWRLDRLGRADVQHLLELGAVRATSHPGEGRRLDSRLPGRGAVSAAASRSGPTIRGWWTAKRPQKDSGLSIDQICKMLGISRPTFYRYLALSGTAAK